MATWKCKICGYVHSDAVNGEFGSLPADWVCPICKADKSAFVVEGEVKATQKVDESQLDSVKKELTPLELSALCSNLARGCEKQYLQQQSELFAKLAEYFKSKASSPQEASMQKLSEAIKEDTSKILPLVQAIGKEKSDRGALRAYTWCEKVTGILESLLNKYNKEGDSMLENTGVYVCTICGFIYVGDQLPQLCPVCKVPNYKFEEIGGNGDV